MKAVIMADASIGFMSALPGTGREGSRRKLLNAQNAEEREKSEILVKG